MKARLAILFALIASTAFADEIRSTGLRVLENPIQDGNFVMRVNDGGVKTDALTITGSTAVVTLSQPLPVGSGGAGRVITPSNGGLVWTDTDSLEVLAGTATASQWLCSGATATPSWCDTTTRAKSVIADDATNNDFTTLFTLNHTTSGTPTNGLANQLLFNGESSTTAARFMGSIRTTWTEVTDASRTASMSFSIPSAAGSSTQLPALFLFTGGDAEFGATAGQAHIDSTPTDASTPTYGYVSDTNTGTYRPAENEIALVVGGTERAHFSGTSGTPDINNTVGDPTDPSYAFVGRNMGMFSNSTSNLGFAVAGVTRFIVGSANYTFGDSATANTGNAAVFALQKTSSSTSCNAHCQNDDGTTGALDSGSGICIGAWDNSGTASQGNTLPAANAVLATTCGDNTTVAKTCLCLGVQ